MKKLSKQDVRALVTRFENVGKQGTERTDPEFLNLLQQEVQVDMPLGELGTTAIESMVKLWKLQGLSMVIGEITDRHQYNAQGMEGLVSITMRLAAALLTATKVDPYRIEIFVPPRWKGGKYCAKGSRSEEEEDTDGEADEA